MRLDQWLVKYQKVRSRSQAEELIKRGEVLVLDLKLNVWVKIIKPSYLMQDSVRPEDVKIESILKDFVARSGYKLKKAIEFLNLPVSDLDCLDIGQSTGGFSQVLLEMKANKVVGIDVGQNQLSSELNTYKNLKSFENLDIRQAKDNLEFFKEVPFDLIVVDVSFISLMQVLGPAVDLLKKEGSLLALVKPQFELSKKDLDRKGLVKDMNLYAEIEKKIKNFSTDTLNMLVLNYFKSDLAGKDGNTEFFIHLKPKP